MPYFRFLLLSYSLFFLSACISSPDFPAEGDCLKSAYNGVFVLNEGQFGSNASSVDVWDEPQNCTDVFGKVNNTKMGDTGQDMLRIEDTLFILMNGSNLLHKIQLPSFSHLATLHFPSGYSMQALDNIDAETLYISGFDLSKKEGRVLVVNAIRMEIEKEIVIEKYPYGLTHDDTHAFVACGTYLWNQPGNQKVCVINTQTHGVEQYISCPFSNVGQVLLYGDTLIVACKGQSYVNLDTGSVLFLINRQNYTPIKSVFLSGNLYEMALAGNYLFAIRDDNSSTIPSQATTLLRMNLQTGEVEEDFLSESFFQADTEDFLYGIDYDTEKSELYISFATGGKGFRLNPFSQIVGNFPTGNYPRKILFYR